MNNQQPTTPKSSRPLTGCGCLTLAAGIGFSVSILFIKGYPLSDRLFSCLFSLLATWILVRVSLLFKGYSETNSTFYHSVPLFGTLIMYFCIVKQKTMPS